MTKMGLRLVTRIVLPVVLIIAGCSHEIGTEPVGPVTYYSLDWWPLRITQPITITASRTEMAASAADSVKIKVLVFDTASGLPVKSALVALRCDLGTLPQSVPTNDSGIAVFWYKGAAANKTATIWAMTPIGDFAKDSIQIELSGVKLEVLSKHATIFQDDTARFAIRIIDGVRRAVVGAMVSFDGIVQQELSTDTAGYAYPEFSTSIVGSYSFVVSSDDLLDTLLATVLQRAEIPAGPDSSLIPNDSSLQPIDSALVPIDTSLIPIDSSTVSFLPVFSTIAPCAIRFVHTDFTGAYHS